MQLTSNSVISDFINPILENEYFDRSSTIVYPSSSSTNYSSYVSSHNDETIIPILCSSQRSQTPTSVKRYIPLKLFSSSVPRSHRTYVNNDIHPYIHHPYHYIRPLLETSPRTPSYYTSLKQKQHFFVDPYQTALNGHIWQSILPLSCRHSNSYHRFHTNQRSLSQLLWDVDSDNNNDDSDDDSQNNNIHTRCRVTPTRERLKDFHTSDNEDDYDAIEHIDDHGDDDQENLYNKKPIWV